MRPSWQPIASLDKQQAPAWLFELGSLTDYLHARYQYLQLKLLSHGWHGNTWQRQICFCDGDRNIEWAAVLVSSAAFSVVGSQLESLGDRPLGHLLFHQEPKAERIDVEACLCDASFPWFAAAQQVLGSNQSKLWFRRSVFSWQGIEFDIIEAVLE